MNRARAGRVFVVACALVVGFLFAPTQAEAAPIKVWSFIEATNYENGTIIPQGDLSTKLHCGLQQGGPWLISQMMSTPSPSTEDMAFVVQGLPGNFWCTATHISAQYFSESGYSNEVGFSVTGSDLNLVPNPPTLISVTHLDALIREFSIVAYDSRWAVG